MTGLLLFALFGGVAYAIWWASETNQLRRQLRAAKTFSIGDMPEGTEGRVIGRARILGETLAAPLSGRPCVYYIAKVEQYVSNGKTGRWKKIIEERNGVVFGLEDGTGRAIIDAPHAKLLMTFDAQSRSGAFDDPTPIEKAFLERHAQSGQGWLFNKKLRYTEAVISEGETIAVLGSGTREPDPDAPPASTYRGEQPTRLRLTSSPRYPLVISEDPSTTAATAS